MEGCQQTRKTACVCTTCFSETFFAAVFVFAYLNLHKRFLQGFFRASKETGRSHEVFLVVPAN